MKDWKERAIKTFIQAFGGVVIPEVVILLSDITAVVWSNWLVWGLPIICAGLAAGISAAWNIILEKLQEE